MMCAGQCIGVMPKANRAAASGRRRSTKKAWPNQSIEPRLSLSRAADANGIPGWYRGPPQWLPVATLRTGQGTAGHVCPQSTALARGTPQWLPGQSAFALPSPLVNQRLSQALTSTPRLQMVHIRQRVVLSLLRDEIM